MSFSKKAARFTGYVVAVPYVIAVAAAEVLFPELAKGRARKRADELAKKAMQERLDKISNATSDIAKRVVRGDFVFIDSNIWMAEGNEAFF